jgi:hypothetical protein
MVCDVVMHVLQVFMWGQTWSLGQACPARWDLLRICLMYSWMVHDIVPYVLQVFMSGQSCSLWPACPVRWSLWRRRRRIPLWRDSITSSGSRNDAGERAERQWPSQRVRHPGVHNHMFFGNISSFCFGQDSQGVLCYIFLPMSTISSPLHTYSRRFPVHVFRRRVGLGEGFAFTNLNLLGGGILGWG